MNIKVISTIHKHILIQQFTLNIFHIIQVNAYKLHHIEKMGIHIKVSLCLAHMTKDENLHKSKAQQINKETKFEEKKELKNVVLLNNT